MPDPITLPVDHVYLHTGLRLEAQEFGDEVAPTNLQTGDGRCALLLYWPREREWLNVRGSLIGPGGTTELKSDLLECEKVCSAFGRTLAEIAGPKRPDFFSAKMRLLAAPYKRGDKLKLVFEIDTSSKKWQRKLEEEGSGEQGRAAERVKLYYFDGRGSQTESDQGEIAVSLAPVSHLPAFGGYVAIDVGNTSSAVAAQPKGFLEAGTILSLDPRSDGPRLARRETAVPSQVRVTRVLTWEAFEGDRRYPGLETDDADRSSEFVIGEAAGRRPPGVGGETEGLILGAKRLVAGRRSREFQKIYAQHAVMRSGESPKVERTPVEIQNRIPCELLVTGLLQQFSRAPVEGDGAAPAGWASRIALTYPTTYTPQEIERLRRCTHRAWLRSIGRRQTVPKNPPGERLGPDLERTVARLQAYLETARDADSDPKSRSHAPAVGDDPLVLLLIDEATAAAFYYLNRHILELPGGVVSFNYFYKHGLNLLLYDVGGGTTDVSLVKAYLDPAAPRTVRLKVAGQTGLRYFGGDNVTLAVARLLKAKVAAEVMRDLQLPNTPARLPEPPEDQPLADRLGRTAEVQKFIQGVAHADEFVPTKFDPNRVDKGTLALRDHAATLFAWAEKVKKELALAPKVLLDRAGVSFAEKSSALADAILAKQPSAPSRKPLGEKLGKIAVYRSEIDALVGASVQRSIDGCNELIRVSLREGRPADEAKGLPSDQEPLHLVVVTGNGSRYPLFKEVLREKLHVLEIDQPGVLIHDETDLKNAVAKGAVQALALTRGGGSVRFQFDTLMSECLPFEVAYRNLFVNTFPKVYPQQARYDSLKPEKIPHTLLRGPGDGAEAVKELTLYRRFPGDQHTSDKTPFDQDMPTMVKGYSPFVTFDFLEPISGDVTVSYDADSQQFAAVDGGGQEGLPREVEPEKVYRSPAQRGDL